MTELAVMACSTEVNAECVLYCCGVQELSTKLRSKGKFSQMPI